MKNVCTKNLVLQIDQGKPDNLSEKHVLSKLTMDQGNLMSETVQVHTQWKNNLPLKKIGTLRLFNTDNEFKPCKSTRKILTSTFQDYRILQWHDHMESKFKIWFKKIKNDPHQQALQLDLEQRQQFCPFSKEIKRHDSWSWEHRIMRVSRCATQSQKCSCRVGTSPIVCCTCGHFLRDGTEENKKFFHKYTLDSIITPRKGDPTATASGRSQEITSIFIANQLKKKCKKKHFLGVHDRFIRGEKFRKNMIELGRSEEICREMDNLASHTHHITPKKNSSVSHPLVDPFEHSEFQHDARKASSWFQTSLNHLAAVQNTKKMQLITKIGKVLDNGLSTARCTVIWPPIIWGFSELIWFRITVQNSVTANRSSLSPKGGVNSTPPTHFNSMKNGFDENNKSDKTSEINDSIIINNNKWNMNTHNNTQVTNQDTNDDVDFDNCVVHTVRWACT